MAETIADRLAALNIELPAPAAAAANYIPAKRTGNLLVVSGQLPMAGGALRYRGKLGEGVGLEEGQAAAKLCAINILAQINAVCGDLEQVAACVRLGGFVANRSRASGPTSGRSSSMVWTATSRPRWRSCGCSPSS